MIVQHDVSLSQYSTMKIGGRAKNLYTPENTTELIETINRIGIGLVKIISGGSNILINDQSVFSDVIVLTKFDTSICYLGDGTFHVGASVKLSNLITAVNQKGYAGIESLYGVPALVGGACCMNAGFSESVDMSMGAYIVDVTVYDGHETFVMSKDLCEFSHRASIFRRDRSLIILSCTMRFRKAETSEIESARESRIQYNRKTMSYGEGSLGTIFCKCNSRICKLFSLFSPSGFKGCKYSKRQRNWIVNAGKGTFKQAMMLINATKIVHRLFGKECKLEIDIWQ